jgi:hypothetical protein
MVKKGGGKPTFPTLSCSQLPLIFFIESRSSIKTYRQSARGWEGGLAPAG